jgi:hypothetical protein
MNTVLLVSASVMVQWHICIATTAENRYLQDSYLFLLILLIRASSCAHGLHVLNVSKRGVNDNGRTTQIL